MLGVPGQCKSVALMLDYKLDFSCCANKDSFRRDSHIYICGVCSSIGHHVVASPPMDLESNLTLDDHNMYTYKIQCS